MIQPLVVGNWKMNKTIGEAVLFAGQLKERLKGQGGKTVAVAPPFISLYPVAEAIKGSGICLAAQNVCDREEGAYTGEVSARMLADAGWGFGIVGHSERRAFFGEDDGLINRKMQRALKYKVIPIFCIGESLEEREAGVTFTVLERQGKEGLKNIAPADMAQIVIAYEPVWAIGTGKTAQPEQAAEAHHFIRNREAGEYGEDIACQVPVIYGG